MGETTYVEGEWNTWLTYIENTGTSTAPVFVQRTDGANPFDSIDVGRYSAPALADLDGDGSGRVRQSINCDRTFVFRAGDPDLVVDLRLVVGGDYYYSLIYLENTGTSTTPVFVQRTGSTNPFYGIDVGYNSAPALADLDNDGTLGPRPSIDKLRYRMFCVLRRRPGPRNGRLRWLAHLHREHRGVYCVRAKDRKRQPL